MDAKNSGLPHTTLPWSCRQQATGTWCVENKSTVAHVYGSNKTTEEGNARLIVRAVNAHADLLAALQALCLSLSMRTDEKAAYENIITDHGPYVAEKWKSARAAVAKVAP